MSCTRLTHSSSASLVTLAGVGVRLSKTLYQAGHKSVQADHNINRIATNVTLFSSSLKHVGATISDTRSLHTPEALDTVKQIVEESNSVFKEITNIVLTATNNKTGDNGEKVGANGRRRRLSLLSRARWYFDQPVAERLLAQLEYLKTTLSVLLQTLNLAATMANVRRIDDMSEDEVRRVELERAHVETLVIAQHLSVVVLDKYQSIVDGPDYPVQSSSTSESEATVNRRPKLLTQGSANTSMIKLEGNDLNFLERQGSNESDLTVPPINSAQAFVDQLLQRWARLPSRLDIAQEREKEIDLESQADSGDAPTPPKQQRPVLKPEDRDESVPDLKLHPVQSEPAESLSPTNEGLLDTNAPTKTTETRSSTSESSRELSQEDAAPVSSGGYQSNTPAPRRSAFNRTSSNPESEGQLQLQNFQGHQIASNIQRPASAQPDAIQMPPRSPASPGPSPSNALSTMSYYTNRSPPMMATNPYYARAQKPSNYRPPYVMSTCSSSSDTGSDTERSESPPPGRRRKFSQARRDSNISKASNRGSNGSSNGLGIPWRIRITRDKYFDFRDEKLVGPRTPYLPTEPLSWVYSHDNAVTEVSQRWVNEEAITEKRFAFNEARNAPDPGTGEEIAIWRIMQPLKFVSVICYLPVVKNFHQSNLFFRTKLRDSSPSPRPSTPERRVTSTTARIQYPRQGHISATTPLLGPSIFIMAPTHPMDQRNEPSPSTVELLTLMGCLLLLLLIITSTRTCTIRTAWANAPLVVQSMTSIALLINKTHGPAIPSLRHRICRPHRTLTAHRNRILGNNKAHMGLATPVRILTPTTQVGRTCRRSILIRVTVEREDSEREDTAVTETGASAAMMIGP